MESNLKSHQELGEQLKLFFFDEVSPGSAFFLPHGAKLYNNLIEYIRKEYRQRDYSEVISPVIFDKSLWERSGHWFKYKENMFAIECKKSDESVDNLASCCDNHHQFALKAMNCPAHCIMFKHVNPSYRDLPIRYADFGVLHRNEVHGALRGLVRVRKFCQDDAHIFCMESQIKDEIQGVIDFIKKVYVDFNMNIEAGLSLRPEKYIGDLAVWDRAENILRDIIVEFPNYQINEGDGAFYGPKIDINVVDFIGRKHQLASIQLDFNLPERFDLHYKGSNGENIRPVMIHRAVLGSVDRFIGILLESSQGKLPFFINPRQVAIIPVKHDNEVIVNYCNKLYADLKEKGVDVDFIDDNDMMAKKIANCEVLHYSQIIVIGKKEAENGKVNIRGKSVVDYDDYILYNGYRHL